MRAPRCGQIHAGVSVLLHKPASVDVCTLLLLCICMVLCVDCAFLCVTLASVRLPSLCAWKSTPRPHTLYLAISTLRTCTCNICVEPPVTERAYTILIGPSSASTGWRSGLHMHSTRAACRRLSPSMHPLGPMTYRDVNAHGKSEPVYADSAFSIYGASALYPSLHTHILFRLLSASTHPC